MAATICYGYYYDGRINYNSPVVGHENFLSQFSQLSDAERVAINEAGGIMLVGRPRTAYDAYYMAQSPIQCCVQMLYIVCTGYAPTGQADYEYTPIRPQQGYTAVEAYIRRDYEGTPAIRVWNADVTESYKLTADTFKGNAVYDVSVIVRSFMGERLFYFDAERDPVFDEDMLSTLFHVTADGDAAPAVEALERCVAINGVDEYGTENKGTEFVALSKVLLTRQRSFILWETTTATIDGTIAAPKVTYFDAEQQKVIIYTIDSQNAFNTLAEMFPDAAMTFEVRSLANCQPVQVCWLNSEGGYEQYVFTGSHTESAEVKTGGVRYAYNDSAKVAPYVLEQGDWLILGAENLPTEDCERLTTLARSWYILLYDRNVTRRGTGGGFYTEARLVRTYVKDFKGDVIKGSTGQTFEVTICNPRGYNALVTK